MHSKDIHAAIPANGRTRDVLLLAFDGVELLDVSAPASAFSKASDLQPGAYRLTVTSPSGGTVQTNSGVQLAQTMRLDAVDINRIDTVLVAGGDEAALRSAIYEQGVGAWLQQAAPHVRRICSVCTGAFALAAAGLLQDRQATTHWNVCDLLAELSPRTTVQRDRIFVQDGPLWTSAGVTTGLDLALALIEADWGRPLAVQIARNLALFMLRGGHEAQLSRTLEAQAVANLQIRELLAWIAQHLDADLSVPALAARACLSERQFARTFKAQTGQTPAQFVWRARLDQAALYLMDTDWPQDKVAARCGFGCADTLQRAFAKQYRQSPEQFRAATQKQKGR